MSLEDQIMQNFLTLVETQPPLFADCQGELEQLCKSLPEDKEEMSDAIADWCESRTTIRDAMDAMSGNIISDYSKAPGIHGNAPPPPDPKAYRDILENAIRRIQSPPKQTP
ncbi:hypothetical protein [Laspinema olomoucense]|uniref:Uncharacterized protein n=1 Tax=Laspinema olomoucense D3b TaxID=2953688 RepID=A0ABT2N1N1_9CYAN|nr:hypothetical protein [Laspinema sp. D3b]MCT7976586.1 hypothetical protein [Laspinema sp. D3b]